MNKITTISGRPVTKWLRDKQTRLSHFASVGLTVHDDEVVASDLNTGRNFHIKQGDLQDWKLTFPNNPNRFDDETEGLPGAFNKLERAVVKQEAPDEEARGRNNKNYCYKINLKRLTDPWYKINMDEHKYIDKAFEYGIVTNPRALGACEIFYLPTEGETPDFKQNTVPAKGALIADWYRKNAVSLVGYTVSLDDMPVDKKAQFAASAI